MKPFDMFRHRVQIVLVLVLASMLVAPVLGGPNEGRFSKIVVLGDSLSDTGNLFELTGGFPPPPYFEGRSCDGRLWVEYLAEALGMSIADGDNYAVFGATTGTANINDGMNGQTYPGLQQQVDRLLADNPAGLDPQALYIIWAGANDFFVFFETGGNLEDMIATGVGNTAGAIQMLAAAGARNILVPNVPDIGLTPSAISSGGAPMVTQLVTAYNSVLDGVISSLQAIGVGVIELDSFSIFRGMVAHAGPLGFENVTEPFLPAMTGDVGDFLFWDAVHPTTVAHRILGAIAAQELIGPTAHRGLNGRVNGAPAIMK